MFFILSKLLLIFIFPFFWITVFIIAALVIKNPKRKRRCFIIAVVLLLIFSNPFLFNRVARNWDIRSAPLKNTTYSSAIVLGGFTSVDGNNNGYFNGSADRFIQGLRLLETGKTSHILISGGNGLLIPGAFRESDWVRSQLLQLKVPDSCIVVENRSRNTLENAAFSKDILMKKHLQPPYLLVTSAFHMRR